jgi:predicted nucleic acid-binding protein
VTIAFEDLLIAATALQLGFGVVTGNIRHFEQIPALRLRHHRVMTSLEW